jgi:hypothetical protein
MKVDDHGAHKPSEIFLGVSSLPCYGRSHCEFVFFKDLTFIDFIIKIGQLYQSLHSSKLNSGQVRNWVQENKGGAMHDDTCFEKGRICKFNQGYERIGEY